MTRRAVVLFARTPEQEVAAKRLPARAVAMFERFIASWLVAAEAANATPIIACDDEARRRLSSIAPTMARAYLSQGRGTFGERLAYVAAGVARAPFDAIVIAAIDAAAPPDLQRAFRIIEAGRFRAVIGPARDGGVNFIAFAEPPLDFLRTFTVRERHTTERCDRYFGRVYRFAAAPDVDSVHDLAPVAFHADVPLFVARELTNRVISRGPPAA